MRVLVVTNMLPLPTHPWAGVFVKEQIEDLRKEGVEVSVIFVRGLENATNYFRAPARIRRALRTQPVDLVHAHYGLTGAVAVWQRTTPVVTTFHGSDCSGDSKWQLAISYAVARLSTPIFVSAALARRVRRDGSAVIPMAVDLARFQPIDRALARRTLGWAENEMVALLPGSRRSPNKRADLFDAALAHARCSVPRLRSASLEGLGRDDVALVMNAVDVVVMTSNYEGSPVAVREALACLTPVVSVPVGDAAALLTDLPGCAVVPRDPERLGEAVVAALRAERSQVLRERVEPFGRPRVVKQVVSVYERVLNDAHATTSSAA